MDEYRNLKQGWTITIAMMAFWGLLMWYWGDKFFAGFFAGGVFWTAMSARQNLKAFRRELSARVD